MRNLYIVLYIVDLIYCVIVYTFAMERLSFNLLKICSMNFSAVGLCDKYVSKMKVIFEKVTCDQLTHCF